jgi:hypothetical protein
MNMNFSFGIGGNSSFAPSIDPLMPTTELIKDPYKLYSELRDNAPVYRSPFGLIVVTRHQDIAPLLKDKRFGRGHFYFEGLARRQGSEILEQPVYQSLKNMMLMKDDSDHSRLRSLMAESFHKSSIQTIRGNIERIVDNLIDNAIELNHFDFMEDFAYPLATNAICDFLGIPESDRSLFLERNATGSRVIEPAPLSPSELRTQNAAISTLDQYFESFIEYRKKHLSSDITSKLISACNKGVITHRELIDNLRMIFIGGKETTVNTIGNGMLALYQHPSQVDAIKNDLSLIPGAVEEFLRYDASVQMTPRQALEECEIAGERVYPGETLICVLGSANRDPAAYPDPDQFDITRSGTKTVSFGGGPHFCIGAFLGRLEAEVCLEKISKRMPRMSFPHINEPDWMQSSVVFRGLQSLPAIAG